MLVLSLALHASIAIPAPQVAPAQPAAQTGAAQTSAAVARQRVLPERPYVGPSGTNWDPGYAVGAPMTVTDLNSGITPFDLVRFLVGPEVFVPDHSWVGANVAAGIFMGGISVVGFENGVVLSTGNVNSVSSLVNQGDGTTTINAFPGDADLDALIPDSPPTFDAAVLEFDFACPETTTISFQFVFSSDEYNEWVNSPLDVNDLFGFFLNGASVPLIPGTTRPLSVNSVNCGNPYDPPDGGLDCASFINNDCHDLEPGGLYPCVPPLATEMDGLTIVFTATADIDAGLNHIKFAIADMFDHLVDSNVFIRSESFSCSQAGAPVFEPPTPCGQTLGASAGVAVEFDVVAIATNGEPDQAVTLQVAGDPAPLAGGTFDPPLPTGPSQPAATTFSWTPTQADVGQHTLVFTAVDQLGVSAECTVTIEVAECFLLVGGGAAWEQLPMGGPEDILLVDTSLVFPVTMTEIPTFHVPDVPGMSQARFYFQVIMVNPFFDPADPYKVSNGLEVRVDGPVIEYGQGSGMRLRALNSAQPGEDLVLVFTIDGL